MNGALLAEVLKLAPELVPIIEKFRKAKDNEIQTLLLAQLLRTSKEGFDRLEQRLDMMAKVETYNRTLLESMTKNV